MVAAVHARRQPPTPAASGIQRPRMREQPPLPSPATGARRLLPVRGTIGRRALGVCHLSTWQGSISLHRDIDLRRQVGRWRLYGGAVVVGDGGEPPADGRGFTWTARDERFDGGPVRQVIDAAVGGLHVSPALPVVRRSTDDSRRHNVEHRKPSSDQVAVRMSTRRQLPTVNVMSIFAIRQPVIVADVEARGRMVAAVRQAADVMTTQAGRCRCCTAPTFPVNRPA